MVHLISVKVHEFTECVQPQGGNDRKNQQAIGENSTENSTANKQVLVPTTEEAPNDDFPPSERWRIWKNVLALGFAFMLNFTAFWGASNLQSSINADESLGTFTLAAIYASLLLSNIFLPVIVIKYLGCKWTSSISLITYMPFILAQFYPRFYTMIPAGLAVGLGGGPLWCAKCTYLSVVADAYSTIAGVPSDVIVTRFFGVFFMFYQFSQVWGNLISSAVLSDLADPQAKLFHASNETLQAPTISSFLASVNSTLFFATDAENTIANYCGAKFHPSQPILTENPNLEKPSTEKIHRIAGIYLACIVAACFIIALFVDSLTRYNKGRMGSGGGLSGFKLIAVTMKQLGNTYQLLIMPITMFIGAEQAFLAADFTASFVSCGWGIKNIGFVMICYGVCNALSALCTGSIVKLTGRFPVLMFALLLHISLIAVLQIWEPDSVNTTIYFVVAGCWGLCDAIWLVQINSLYGIIFPGHEEASYSNFRLWESTGSVITYAYNPFLPTRIKVYLLLGLLLIGFTGYAYVEHLERDGKNKKKRDRILTEKNKFKLVQGTGSLEQQIANSQKATREVAH